MSTYRAPLADMQFVLNELAGLAEVAQAAGLRGCDARHGRRRSSRKRASSPPRCSIRSTAPAIAKARSCCPTARSRRRRASRRPTGSSSRTAGTGSPSPTEYGGQGLPQLVATPVEEMWHAANMAFDLCPLLTQGAIEALELCGTPTSRRRRTCRRWSPATWTGTMNLTEPQAGSDLAAVRTRAVPQGDGTLQALRAEDLHHLRRARLHRQHHPPGARAHARRARRRQGHLAVPRAEVPGQRRRLARRAQRRALRVARAQARHPREPDRGAGVRRPRRRDRLPGRRGEPRPRVHVHHDERGALLGRHGRRRASPSAPTSARVAYARERVQGSAPVAARRQGRRRSSTIRTSAAC